MLMEYGLSKYQYRRFDEVELPEEATEDIIVSNGQGSKIGEKLHLPVEMVEEDTGKRRASYAGGREGDNHLAESKSADSARREGAGNRAYQLRSRQSGVEAHPSGSGWRS